MSIWNIWGLLGRDGREIPFKTFKDLKTEIEKRAQETELNTTNLHIKVRNEVRDRKDELTQKALGLLEEPSSINHVIQDLCDMIEDSDQYDGLYSFMEEKLIYPLIKNGSIEDIYWQQVNDHFMGTIMIPIYQNVDSIDRQKKYPAVVLEKQEEQT